MRLDAVHDLANLSLAVPGSYKDLAVLPEFLLLRVTVLPDFGQRVVHKPCLLLEASTATVEAPVLIHLHLFDELGGVSHMIQYVWTFLVLGTKVTNLLRARLLFLVSVLFLTLLDLPLEKLGVLSALLNF